MSTEVRQARTQQERRERTRAALLDATVDCLVDLGYSGTTVHEICRRAGLSRGAQQHHFTTKAELMVAAVEHLFQRLRDEVTGSLVAPPGPQRVHEAIELLWRGFSGKLSTAALELWVAARTDEELRRSMLPVDRALGRSTLDIYREAAGVDVPDEKLETLYWLTVNLTRGLALDAMIGGDPARRARLLDEWKAIAAAAYHDVGRPGPRSGRPTP
ncbi:TetR/AcrR family transcriptional regulator [Kibdelosporangium phytohabitans]|uniref:TetR family transcriptional regulator n=1 Tax=Kibdelosporangium phytohabitans TaxID=860235 RepID=A0A0N9IC15_9PSEU|nr:TetR/AcrR family transcriptional regulator [Kibdelosporangium phytohabitans]ALG12750.1 TetR family transcriptional regulator [Kibdelosporangium phytohabitans]MBE1464424.1 AcrR family transcriptional regulator [Kibdelosporangium phytohabitans]